jgi:monovalent cation/hydrogen antiporter
MTGVAEIFVGLLLAVAVLALVARRLTIPYPILFVIGGLALGLIPKLPKVRLDPDLVFLFVLPPLLFPAAVLISFAVIVIRILWVFPATYLPRLIFKKLCRHAPYPKWQHEAIVAWTGMRGVVSLAAALALPLTLNDGSPVPGRELILFVTFVVILVTLVPQGLSLPVLIRRLGVKDDGSMDKEELEARLKANQAALARLNEVAEHDLPKADALNRLRVEYEDHIRQIEGADPASAGAPLRLFSSEYERLSHEALTVERKTIVKLRNEDVINDEGLRRIQRDIDLAEARL